MAQANRPARLDDDPADERTGLSDAELARRAQTDRRAFVPLYRRYVDPVYRFCRRRLGTREEAEDATALVFERALASLSAFRGGSVRAWLFAIADRQTIDCLRARRPTASLDAALDVPDRAASPEEIALASHESAHLRAMLAHLTPDQRRVIELRLSGLTGQEIAQVMDRTRNAVDAIQFRAFNRLRRLGLGARDREGRDG